MQVFVARQAIFDTKRRVVAYELLFRSGVENVFPRGMDSDLASAKVIGTTMSTFDFESLTSGKKAYINVTRQVLCAGLYSILPPSRTVIELLETVTADDETLAAVRAARQAGFEVALDDFVSQPATEPFVPLAQVLKVDFLATLGPERRRIRERTRKQKITLLAEKVENAEELRDAEAAGYTLFQGFFFQRPEMVAREDIAPSKLTYVRFLRELQAPELDWGRIEAVIKPDVSLAMKLLKFLNSATFGWHSRVTSLRQALVLLGERPFRKWASLIAVVGMTEDRPAELAVVSLARAHFCERLCPLAGLEGRQLDAFLVGLMSSLAAMVGRPLEELLMEIGVSADVNAALLGETTALGRVRALALAFEDASWPRVSELAAALGITESALPEIAVQSLAWATNTLAG